MPEAVPLRLIDPDTGEMGDAGDDADVTRLKAIITGLENDVTNLESDLRGKRAQIKALKADREREARNHPRRQEIEAVWAYWMEKCRHPRSKLDAERTFRIAWALETYGIDIAKLAIDGAATEPFVRRRANGTLKKFDELGLVYRDAEHIEDFAARADREALAAYKAKREEQDAPPS